MYKSRQIEKYQEYRLLQWKDRYYTYRGTVTYGMHYILGNSQPYFSITASTERKGKNGHGEVKWFEDSCGCLHDLIKKKARHLAPLIDFHLASQDGLPMYYVENALYWLGKNPQGERKDLKIFKEHILLEPREIIPEVEGLSNPEEKEVMVNWLKSRIPRLKQRFDEVMREFKIEYITEEEINKLKSK